MKSNILKILLVIWIILGIICGIYAYRYFNTINTANEEIDELREISGTDDRGIPNLDELYAKNNDLVGWIKIDDTNIDYPVMQNIDEGFYLEHGFNKQYNFNGLPFCSTLDDVKRPSENITIQAHNIKTGAMFHDLVNYSDVEYYKSHGSFKFDTRYGQGDYKIIAVVKTSANPGYFEYWNVDNCTKKEFSEYITWLTDNSVYHIADIDDVRYGDKLVTLSTCAYHANNGRIIVVGKKL